MRHFNVCTGGRANLKLEIAFVVGGDIDLCVDDLALIVRPDDDAVAVLAARFVRARRRQAPVVATDTTAAAVAVVLLLYK